jgi:hypothetical protein
MQAGRKQVKSKFGISFAFIREKINKKICQKSRFYANENYQEGGFDDHETK